jgi:hypothetical protein
MIEQYSFGSITILGRQYSSDLKIINGQVHSDWWRKTGHSVDLDDIPDILSAKPDYLVIGSGSSGLMKVSDDLRQHLEEIGVEVIVEPTPKAMGTFNLMYEDDKKVAGAFHLTC